MNPDYWIAIVILLAIVSTYYVALYGNADTKNTKKVAVGIVASVTTALIAPGLLLLAATFSAYERDCPSLILGAVSPYKGDIYQTVASVKVGKDDYRVHIKSVVPKYNIMWCRKYDKVTPPYFIFTDGMPVAIANPHAKNKPLDKGQK